MKRFWLFNVWNLKKRNDELEKQAILMHRRVEAAKELLEIVHSRMLVMDYKGRTREDDRDSLAIVDTWDDIHTLTKMIYSSSDCSINPRCALAEVLNSTRG